MTDVVIVGGGPAGLSAALFTAKNDLETVVFDADETWMHKAHLYNYLGIESIDGSEFMEAAREHVEAHGATIREEVVEAVGRHDGGFVVETDADDYDARYLVLATGTDRELAEQLGCETTEDGTVAVGLDMETSVENAYATGGMVRDRTWQAVISAGDGGAAALDVLSKEAGEPFHDFDSPE
ncbi:thioredoxin reductase [Halobacteriales archaeon QS_1_68_20]|nr:MAG: thioredoxin reductase [Halobacteriales archaeon QS_1_68_20]